MPNKTQTADTDQITGGLTIFESKLLSLLALMLVQERKQAEQIDLLARAGFRPMETAQLLGTTPNTVSVALSQLKREKKPSKGKKKSGK